jgi:choline dehydrogenase-like flavoprotein
LLRREISSLLAGVSFVVIGSGPAGVAAASALSQADRPVTLLDAGDTIEPGRMDVFADLAQMPPQSWPSGLANRARAAFPVTAKHVPLKPAYGSLFPYALEDTDLPVTRENAETVPSLALGGLSNCWGASMLPARQRDIDDWPITLAELEPHYEAVLRFVPMAAEYDELSEQLPLYSNAPGRLRRGAQAQVVLGHLRRHAAALELAGFTFGASRLAVEASTDAANSCRQCGLCMYGCPYGSIYNASHTLDQLVRRGKVDYRGGLYVDRLVASDRSVTVHFHERGRPASRGQLNASRVFVACGAVSSTRLMLESLGGSTHACRLLDSQYFLVPMITARAARVSVATQGNTLAQVFLELDHTGACRHPAHLQLYGYNDLLLSLLAARLPLSADRLQGLLRPALGRLVIMQGYLHSADSPGMRINVDAGAVQLIGDDPLAARTRVKRLVRRLAANAGPLGMAPVPGLTQMGQPGKGNHLGGSFPMQRHPGEWQTDTLGRLPRWDRVHLVDAAVLPSVPATTITLSVMANAHRIATAAATIAD